MNGARIPFLEDSKICENQVLEYCGIVNYLSRIFLHSQIIYLCFLDTLQNNCYSASLGRWQKKVYTDTIICHIVLSHSWFNPQMRNPWIQRANCIFRSGTDDPTAQPCFNVPRHNHIILPRGGSNLNIHAVIKNFLCMYKIMLFIQTFFYSQMHPCLLFLPHFTLVICAVNLPVTEQTLIEGLLCAQTNEGIRKENFQGPNKDL